MIKKFINISLLVFFILIVWQEPSFSQNKNKQIDQFLSLCQEYRIFSGTALVAENGKVIFQKGFGLANRSWNIQNDIDTKYKVGSITKQFTSMLILQLVEEGKIKLEENISKYLPNYPKDKGNKITIHHLLCHTNGIPNLARQYKNWFSELWFKDYSTEGFIKLFCDLDLEFEPGTRFSYSNAGYYLLATIIEKITGKSFGKVLKEKIFIPLNMKNSGHIDYYTVLPKMATGYEYWNYRFSNTGYNSATTHKGNGGIYSTVEDLFKWDRALYTEKLISKRYLDLMFKPQMSLRAGSSYAYGWVVGEKYLHEIDKTIPFAEHYGSDNGFNNVITRLTNDNHVIILLSNMSQTRLPLIPDQIINIIYDLPYNLPKPISISLSECRTIQEIQATITKYRNSNNDFLISQDAVNGLGFKFLHDNKNDLGIAVLQFNANEFSQSSFVYESLGEAYLMINNKKLAIKNLKKAFELDPNNVNVKKKLDELRN